MSQEKRTTDSTRKTTSPSSRRLGLLRLRLRAIQSEARAARLEANAARLEYELSRASREPVDEALGKKERCFAGTINTPNEQRSREIGVDGSPAAGTSRSADAVSNRNVQFDGITSESAASIVPGRKLDQTKKTVRSAENKTDRRRRRARVRQPPKRTSLRRLPKRRGGGNSTPGTGNVARSRHRSRKAWRRDPLLTSLLAHVCALILLAFISLKSHRALDQVALTATTTDESEQAMESIQISSPDPPAKAEQEPVTTESSVEITEPTIAPMDLALSSFVAEPLPAGLLASGGQAAKTASKAIAALDKEVSSSTFCGVEGGGNHFVYLVDSSKSMSDSFAQARQEVIRAVSSLSEDQRFYVIFFDESPAYMQLSVPGVDDSRSVLATRENQAALKRWALNVRMDGGRAPHDPLRFAISLQPDVIFLLSDGMFPASIAQMLQRENHYENLFGEQHVRSIVHTIGFHRSEGEERMRQIASENRGRYRFVPSPPRR